MVRGGASAQGKWEREERAHTSISLPALAAGCECDSPASPLPPALPKPLGFATDCSHPTRTTVYEDKLTTGEPCRCERLLRSSSSLSDCGDALPNCLLPGTSQSWSSRPRRALHEGTGRASRMTDNSAKRSGQKKAGGQAGHAPLSTLGSSIQLDLAVKLHHVDRE